MSDLKFLTFTMSPDDLANTVFTDDSNEILYTVSTENLEHNAVTTVKNALGDTVGTLSWTDSISNSSKVLLPGQDKFVSFDKWMSKSIIPMHDATTFTAPNGEVYKWTGNRAGGILQLWMKEDHKHPVARFYRSHFGGKDTQTVVKAKLLIDTRVSEIQDTVVAAFVFLEKFRRHHDHSVTNRNAGLSVAPLLSPLATPNVANNGGGLI